MASEELTGLLRGLFVNREDTGRRLVLADWLAEQGEPRPLQAWNRGEPLKLAAGALRFARHIRRRVLPRGTEMPEYEARSLRAYMTRKRTDTPLPPRRYWRGRKRADFDVERCPFFFIGVTTVGGIEAVCGESRIPLDRALAWAADLQTCWRLPVTATATPAHFESGSRLWVWTWPAGTGPECWIPPGHPYGFGPGCRWPFIRVPDNQADSAKTLAG